MCTVTHPRCVVLFSQVAVEILDTVAVFNQLHKLHFAHYVLPLLYATQPHANSAYISKQQIGETRDASVI